MDDYELDPLMDQLEQHGQNQFDGQPQNLNPYLIKKMCRSIANEMATPELLFHEQYTVNALWNEVLNREKDFAEGPIHEDNQLNSLFQLEVDRIKYMLYSYSRVRLRKIQKLYLYIAATNDELAKMSEAEIEFYNKFSQARQNHMFKSTLRHMPKGYSELGDGLEEVPTGPEKTIFEGPNLGHFVFMRTLRDIQLDFDGYQQTIPQNKGIILPYNHIQAYIHDDSVHLG